MKLFPRLLLLAAWPVLLGPALRAQTSAPPAVVAAPAVAAPATNAPAAVAAPPAVAAVVAVPAAGAVPGATNAPAVKTARDIRFQFDGIPYTDVVERFAQMAGKPLLAETNLSGTLTYDDPHPYNLTEALDTLNLILAMKGTMLVEDGNNLRLVPFRQLPAMPLRILRGTDPTGDIRPAEVVTVVLDTSGLDAKEVGDSVLPMLSPAGSLAPLGKGRGLIITDRQANIQRVRTLLATIGNAQPGDRSMKTYNLTHGSGGIIADLLNRTFGVATAPKRTSYNPTTKVLEVLPPDPNDYVTAVYDEASRTLVLFGPPERTRLAEELISKFEEKDGVGGDVRIYYPQSIKAEELAAMIRQAIPGVAQPNETAANSATKARVIADVGQNRIIVAAPIPGQLDQIEQLVVRVDKDVVGAVGRPENAGAGRSQTIQLTKVFHPRATEASNVLAIVRQALSRRNGAGQSVMSASVSYAPGSQSLVVTGSPGELQIATDLLAQLGGASNPATPLVTKFVDVGSPEEAQRLQPLLEKLYLAQSADPAGTPAARFLADPASGRLILTATEEQQKRLAELLQQLRTDQAPADARRLRVVPLQHSRSETALPAIQSLVGERMADRRFALQPKPTLVADAPNNRLLVTASEEQWREIEAVVKVVDIAPAQTGRTMVVLPLQTKTAAEIIPLITQLTGQLTSPGELAPTLMPDPTGKQIIVVAAAADQERVRTLVRQFDVSAATAAPRQFRGVELFGRNATEFTPLVQQLYVEQNRGQPEPPGGPATLLPETKSNRIMVSGSEKEIARVEAIIRQLDPAGRSGAKSETRVVRLQHGTAAELAGLVEKSLNAQAQQIKVLVDPRSNSLVVTGEPAAVEAATQMIQQLDTRADGGPHELRILELKSTDAAATAALATTLFAEALKDQRGPDYVTTTKIVPDAAGNRLIVSGGRDELEIVAGLVRKLDNPPEQAAGARVFKLTQTEAALMGPIVSNAMLRFDARGRAVPRVTVTADEKSNSLIVSGTRADLQDVESVIEKLDAEGAGQQRTLKVYEVKGDADALAALVMKVVSAQNPGRNAGALPSITPEPGGKRLFVLAPVAQQAQIETIVTTLDEKPDQVTRELRAIELKNSTAAELLPKVRQIYDEQSKGKTLKPALLYTDASGVRLLVQGTPDQAAAIQQIVETLEAQTRPARESKVFDLGKVTEVQRVMPLVQQLYKDQLGSNPQLGPPDAQIFSDNKTGRLLVSARADQLKIIEEIVGRLKVTSGTAGRETRTFEVGGAAEVQRILPLAQQLYQDQWRDKQDLDPADAQFVPDPKTGRVIVSGKPEHLKAIEAILKELGAGHAHAENRATRIIDLTTASAVELSATVRSLYLEEAKGRLGNQAPDTLITPDAGGNRLIVVGDTNELSAVEELVRKLDKVSSQSASARVFKIKSADPEKVAEILTASLVHYDAYGRPQKRATVSVDAKTRTLIVTGDPKELSGVALIIEQLDQSLGTQAERKMKVITLKQGRVSTLITQARQLYNDRVKSRPDLGTSELLMLEETYSNQIILAGSEEQLKMIDQIIEELQAARTSRSARETRMLEGGTAEEMARLQPLVQQLYRDRLRGRDASDPPDAQIISDEKNGRFIVTARTNHLAEIEDILTQLRAGHGGPENRDTRVYELTNATAMELSATVRTLYQEQAKARPGAAASETLILPDSGANRIIVTGATNELALVEDIIRKLDKAGAQSASTRVFKLKSADPEKVAQILGTSLVRYDAYGRPQKRVSVVTDAKTRSIIASGDPKELQSASVIIEQLDASLGEQPARVMRVLAVKDRAVSELSGKLRRVYQDRARDDPEMSATEPLILDDGAGNQLILAGTEKQLTAIEEISQTLQKPTEGGSRQSRVFALERTSAASLVAMLGQVFPRQIGSTDPGERVVVSVGGNDRALVVDAPAAVLARIDELVKDLDQPGPEGANVIQTVKLNKSRAEDLAESVSRAITNRSATTTARRVSVTAVPGANSLLINGPTNAVQDVMKLIHDLDQEGTDPGELEIRMYKLENGAAKEISKLLGDLLQNVTRNLAANSPRGSARVREASVTVDDRANQLIVSGTAAHFKVVEKLLPTLDKAPERSDRDVQFVWLRKAKAFEVANQLDELFKGRARSDRPVIEPDFQGNSLTIIAKRGDLVQIQDLVARLDAQGKTSALQVRVRPLDRVSAEQMAEMLRNIYPQVSGTPVRVAEKVAPTAAAPAGETNAAPEVSIAVDKTANALILSGPAQELDNVDRLVSELSSNFYGNEAEFRLFAIQDADPVVVARTLMELIKQESVVARRPGEAPQAVQTQRIMVVAEPRTRSIIVRARPTDFALMESLVKQLDKAGQLAQLDFRVVPLTNAPPEKVLPMVQQMVTQLNTTRPGESVTVGLDPLARGLLVVARETTGAQIEKMIRTLDQPAAHAEAEVRIISLRKANAAQLALVLQNMLKPGTAGETLPAARELQEQVSRLRIINDQSNQVVLDLTQPIKIEADPVAGAGGANRLLLTSTPDNLRALAAVVEMLDAVAVTEGVDVRWVKLRHAEATLVTQTLTTIFAQGKTLAAGPAGPTAEPGGAGKALVSPLNVAGDAHGNTVVLSGRPESLDLALKLIEQLDVPAAAGFENVRFYTLEHANPAAVQKLLTEIYTSPRATNLRAEDKPLIALDARTSTLIVAGNEAAFGVVETLVKRLDTTAANPALTLSLLPLHHNDAAKVAVAVESIFAARLKAQVAPGQTPLPADQIKLEPDPLNNSLIVSASRENLVLITDLVAKLDQEPTVSEGVLETFTLTYADAQRVAAILKSLVDQGLYRPGRPATATAKTGTGRDVLSVSVDARSNTLIVSASPENLAIVRDIVKRIDNQEWAANADVRLYALKKARATTLAVTLQQFFQAKQTADATGVSGAARPIPVSVIPDDRVNTLLITGGKEAFAVVDRVLPQLDGDSAFARLSFRVFPLQRATALKLQATLQPVFANRPVRVKGEPLEPVTVIADQWVNALLVGASVDDMATAASLIERLDAPASDKGIAIHVFPLAKADAKQVATTVQGLFRENQPNQAVPITIAADERINALVVSCGETDAEHIAELAHKLDTEQVSKVSEIRIFALQFARAEALSTILNTALNTKPPVLNQQSPNAQSLLQFATRGADGRQLITAALKESVLITPDPRMNSLVVSGPLEYMGLLDQIIHRMDASSPQQAKIKVFSLINAEARQLGQVLIQLFHMTQTTVAGHQRTVQYTLVRGATGAGPEAEESLATATVGTAEESALTVTIDPRTNSLLVGGSEHYVDLVEQIINALDSNAARERTSEVIRLKNSQAPNIATAIRGFLDQERQKAMQALGPDAAASAARMFDQEEIAVVAEPTSNTLLLSANQHYFAQVRKIVEDLDKPQPQVLIQVLLAEVTLDGETDLGVEWSVTGKKGGKAYTFGSNLGVANQLSTLGGFSGALTGTDLNFLIRSLETSGKLEVLSRPQIVTGDNMPATINIGQRVPLVEQSRLDVQNNLTTSYTYQDVGVNLSVTPKISADGFVKMDVGMTNSDISASSVKINTSSSVPIIDQRRATTTVTAQSGQTIVIGGLISTSDTKNVKKLPWLGDVPYMGLLFRSTTVIRQRKELLILLTPQVLANVQTPVPLSDPAAVTHKVMEDSIFRIPTDNDPVKRRLLLPVTGTNAPVAAPAPAGKPDSR